MAVKEIIIGTISGMAAGFALGILFAPARGADTRKRLNEQGEEFVEEFRTKLSNYLEKITQRFGNSVPELAEEMAAELESRKKGKRS